MVEPRPAGPRILAAVSILSAVGIVLFWVSWFASGDYATAGDATFRAFENAFPLPDGVLSLLLVLSAVGIWRRSPLALLCGLPATGMLWYLASLDTLFNLQHGGFTDLADPETYIRLFISIHCYALGGINAWILWRHGRHFMSTAPANPVGRNAPRLAACALLIMTIVATALFWTWWYATGRAAFAGDPVARAFHDALPLADALLTLTALAALVGILARRPWGILYALMTTGGIAFAALLYTLYVLISGVPPAFGPSGVLVAVAGCYALASILWVCARDLVHSTGQS